MPLQQSKQRKTNMKVKPIKIKIKQPTPTAADRLYAKHQAIRKEKGLPDPSEYKKKLDGIKTEQLEKKGRFVSGPPKKTFKAPTIVSPIKEAKDPREYDYEGDMATSQLRSLIFNAEDLIDLMDDNTNLPEWVQSKITLAEDYISTAANYLRGELSEAANLAQQAAIAINMKKKGIKPKNEEVEQIDEISQKLAGNYYGAATKQHLAKVGMKPNMYGRIEKDMGKQRKAGVDRALDRVTGVRKTNEEVEYLEEKNAPTNPALWSKAKSLARSKFDVYPSAYANGWAAKWYKSKGGGWTTVSEEAEEPSMAARTLSRKAQIVKDAAKSKKIEKEEASDKFQKDPELSSDIQKT